MYRTTYTSYTYTSSSFRVGLKLCRKSEGLAYENAKNRYPRRTIRPKIDPHSVRTPNSKGLTEALHTAAVECHAH